MHHQPDGAAFDIVLLLHVGCVVVGLVTTATAAATASRLRRLLGSSLPLPETAAALLPARDQLGRPHRLRHPRLRLRPGRHEPGRLCARAGLGARGSGHLRRPGVRWAKGCCGRRSSGCRSPSRGPTTTVAGDGHRADARSRRHRHVAGRRRGARPAGGRDRADDRATLTGTAEGDPRRVPFWRSSWRPDRWPGRVAQPQPRAAADRRRLGVAAAVPAAAAATAATAAAPAAAPAAVGDLDGARGAGGLVGAVARRSSRSRSRNRTTWLTDGMEHDAAPDELVVAVQLCAVLPVPSVRVSGWPLSGVPLLVSVDDSVTEEPLVAVVAPV